MHATKNTVIGIVDALYVLCNTRARYTEITVLRAKMFAVNVEHLSSKTQPMLHL